MVKRIRKLGQKGAEATTRALKSIETRILVSQGRKAVRRKMEITARVTRKAARTGLIAGGLAAVAVVAREIRKRRKAG